MTPTAIDHHRRTGIYSCAPRGDRFTVETATDPTTHSTTPVDADAGHRTERRLAGGGR